uniref:non-specific serine/threonine protein kinase n=1 Tax=Hanusia phi TaxID=3032 RepID=A0A7S0EUZ3_9CRYP|mmetsp:Transcript_31501/g.70878  ORF Transcript_31501/g.70878 Transcript_31501/m.70878 type:complete len:477 (+) Transcript_31501:134-1564(+)
MDKYQIKSKLGSGGFATVWLGVRKADGKTVAIKKIACENFDDANQALSEGKMLLELDHTHVIRYYDFFLHQERGDTAGGRPKMYVVLVMQYAPDGDLFSRLEKAHKEQRHIPEDVIRKWLHQLCKALDYIAGKRIIHRDVKLANVLIDGDNLKLADFGIAKVMHGKFAQTIVGGTPCYMAPELLYKEKYDTKSDIWSLGCMIWELACRCLLSQNKGVLGAQVLKDPGRLREMWIKMEQANRSSELIQLVKKMLQPEIADRCTARDILESSMFRHQKEREQKVESMTAGLQTLGLTRAAGDTYVAPREEKQNQILDRQAKRDVPAMEGNENVGNDDKPAANRGNQSKANNDLGYKPDALTDQELDRLCVEADRYQQARDYERAERCFRKALAINPRHTRSLCNYAYMLHVGKRDFAKSEELYKLALQVEPNRTATLCNYAYLLHSDQRLAEARKIFKLAKDSNPGHPWIKKNEHLFS